MAKQTLAWMRYYEIRSAEEPGLFAVVIVDVTEPGQVEEAFRQVAEQVVEAEQCAAQNLAGRVLHSILAFGAEPRSLRAEEIHAAYNRMWEGHRNLWEAIQTRGLPIALWLIDGADRPYHVIIQPAKNCEFEVWRFRDLRETEFFLDYHSSGGPWQIMLFPLTPEILGQAQGHVRVKRAEQYAVTNRPSEHGDSSNDVKPV